MKKKTEQNGTTLAKAKTAWGYSFNCISLLSNDTVRRCNKEPNILHSLSKSKIM